MSEAARAGNAVVMSRNENLFYFFSPYGTRWLHSDMKDVAFWYNYNLYEKFIEVGGLE